MKIDPYFRPILLSSLIVILLDTVFVLPIPGFPVLTYLAGGVISVLLFQREIKKEENTSVKVFDASILGIATGIIVGSILTLIITFKLQDPEAKQMIIDVINEKMKMKSETEFDFLTNLGSLFYVVTGIITVFLCSGISLFGSLVTLVFINKPKK